jgi:hypothetical protein
MPIYEILLPTQMNGEPIELDHHRRWDRKVRTVSDGLTIFSEAIGQWVSPNGQLIRETVLPVRIVCSLIEMRRIALMTVAHYAQDVVLFYEISDQVFRVSAGDAVGRQPPQPQPPDPPIEPPVNPANPPN